MEALLPLALDGQSRKCEHATDYSHEQLRRWLLEALPQGWTVHAPSVFGDGALASAWPASEEECEKAIRFLSERGCKDPRGTLDGHCEPLALLLSGDVKALLEAGEVEPCDIPGIANVTSLERLKGSKNAAELVFDKFGSGFAEDGCATWTAGVWGSRFETEGSRSDPSHPERLSHLERYLYGGSGVQETVRSFATGLTGAARDRRVGWMPLYVLNYIWHAKELSAAVLCNYQDEAAQYSCHVVGLVMDAERRALCIADPNGGLVTPGNLEFLTVPPTRRTAKPSTRWSQYDLDQKAKQPGRGKKRKR